MFKATREAYHFGSPEVRRFTYLGRSNRIFSEKLEVVGGGNPLIYSYEPDGSRLTEIPTPQDNSFRERWYYYDALGRTTGLGSYVPWRYEPHVCLYDADGQMYKPCDVDSPVLSFDGASVVTAWGNSRWHFVQGEGLDDPLSAVGTWSGDTPKELFFVTDGAGQVLASVDSAGVLPVAVQSTAGWQGWSYHGAATQTQGFSANRLSNNTAPEYSYYRNRIYDQRTGRWTQEDPLGVAGGINLYQFNGNNPVAYTDPFGTCPPKDSSPCTLGDVLSLNVSAGVQLGASVSVGIVGLYGRAQAWRTANFEVSAKYPAELTVSDAELSGEVGGELLGQRGGVKLDIAKDSPQLVGTGKLAGVDVGHETVQRDSRNHSTKIGLQVGLGFELNINWSAAGDIIKQGIKKLKGEDQ